MSRCHYLLAFYDRVASGICRQIKENLSAQNCPLTALKTFKQTTEMVLRITTRVAFECRADFECEWSLSGDYEFTP